MAWSEGRFFRTSDLMPRIASTFRPAAAIGHRWGLRGEANLRELLHSAQFVVGGVNSWEPFRRPRYSREFNHTLSGGGHPAEELRRIHDQL